MDKETSKIYCKVGADKLAIDYDPSLPLRHLYDKLLTNFKQEGQGTIPKIYNADGYMLPIGANITPNSDATPYLVKFTTGRLKLT
jgi:hypothetical protein